MGLGLIRGSQGILGALVDRLMETLGTLKKDPVVLGVPQESRLNSGVLWEHGLFWNPGSAEASELLGLALGTEGSPDHWEVWKTVRYFWNLGDLSGRWVGGRGVLAFPQRWGRFCSLTVHHGSPCFSGNFLGEVEALEVIFKIKRTVVLESWGSLLGVGERAVSRSLLGAFVRGRGV